MIRSRRILLIGSILVACSWANASVTVDPTSYDMLNGHTGSFNYWDDSYTGAGNKQVNGAALTGGLGDLTDGIVASDNWQFVESPRGPHGPYVGWRSNPLITFKFSQAHAFDSVNIHFDDADYGGVSAPLSVIIDGTGYAITDPAGSDPFWANIDVTSQNLNTDTLHIQFVRGSSWVFASEVGFTAAEDVAAVPLPGSLLLVGLGTSVAGYLRRRRSL